MTTLAIGLLEFGLSYESRGPMKAQFLVDFPTELPPHKENQDWWTLSVDGFSHKKESGKGVILEGSDNLAIEQAIRFNFETSNNQVEYEALIVGL